MVFVMTISMLPMPFAQTIVSAASIGAPSADAFISNMKAESGFWTENASLFNKDYNLSGGIKKALYYGKKEGQKWYIAGKNEDGSLILICDQNNALMTDKQWYSSSYNYQYSDQCPYYPNGSYTTIRQYLVDVTNGQDNNYFTKAEQDLMKPSFLYCWHDKTGAPIINDKLYIPDAFVDGENEYINVGNTYGYWFTDVNDIWKGGKPLGGISIKVADYAPAWGNYYWTRGKKEESYGNYNRHYIIPTRRQYCSNHGSDVLDADCADIVPVFHLNMNTVYFASSATSPTQDSPSFIDENAMTVRYNGLSRVKSIVKAAPWGVQVEDRMEGEYLMIQWNDGNRDQVLSLPLVSGKKVYTSADGIPELTKDCRIWIEKKVEADNLAYARMVQFVPDLKKPESYEVKDVILSKETYTYDGKEKKPSVTVTDMEGKEILGTNYTVTYPSGRKNVGSYKVKVNFKGKYGVNGTKYATFTINPPKTAIVSLAARSKAFALKWKKKTAQVTGYEIQYSTSSDFTTGTKKVAVKSYKTYTKTISRLKGKAKYYVRVRTYKTVSGKKYYSDWTGKKSITTKK